MKVSFRRVDWPFASKFRIAYQIWAKAETVRVELREGNFLGRGEGLGISYHGETADSLLAQVAAVEQDLINGISRAELQRLLPAGGARNAIDCALWDLEAKCLGVRAWELAGIGAVDTLITAYTLSLDTAESMRRAAAAVKQYSLLKLKFDGNGDIDRARSVREARPDAAIIVDANQSWNETQLREFTPVLADLGVKLIEQPMAAGNDGALLSFKSPVPLCADESCQTTDSLPDLIGKYDYLNIKLDKTGGLTEALRLARAAQTQGFKLMVGCMAGSSLSMAPAFVVGQLCSIVDLDGPLLSALDVTNGIHYEGSRMHVPEAVLWG